MFYLPCRQRVTDRFSVVLMYLNVSVFIQLRRINHVTEHAILLTLTHRGVGGDDAWQTLTCCILLFLTCQHPSSMK